MNSKIKQIVLTATFSAMAIILGYIEIPFPPAPFLKFDFSEVVILVSLIVLGYSKTGVVIILRTIIRIAIKGDVDVFPFLGEYMAILSSFSIITFYYLATKITKTNLVPLVKKEVCDIEKFKIVKPLIHGLIVTLGFTFVMVLLNFFIVIPIQLSAGEYFFVTQLLNDINTLNSGLGFVGVSSYSFLIFVFILPFNIIKGLLIMVAFELLNTRLKYLEV